MINEVLFPIKWDGWDKIDELFNALYDVEFTDDFGVFKKGEKFRSISIHYAEGVIEAVDDNGDIIKKQFYIAIPKPE